MIFAEPKVARDTCANFISTEIEQCLPTGAGGARFFAGGSNPRPLYEDRPVVIIRVMPITHELLESDIFGYEKSAYTLAKAEGRKGRLEDSADSTLVLKHLNKLLLYQRHFLTERIHAQ